MVDGLINVVLKSLSQMGVTLTNLEVNSDQPSYFLEIDDSRRIYSVEDTLKSVYQILWILTYGKVSDEKKGLKINLKYKVVGENS